MTVTMEEDVMAVWGLRCPKCGHSSQIDIAATVWVRLYPDGTDPADAASQRHDWDSNNQARCGACGLQSEVRALEIRGGDT